MSPESPRPNPIEPAPTPSCLTDLHFCPNCPFVPPPSDELCPVLESARNNREITDTLRLEANQAKTDRIQFEFESKRRIERLRSDQLLEIYSPSGLADRIMYDPALQAELRSNNWGILYLDVRFLKFFNDEIGREAGDDYLRTVRDTVIDLAKHSFRSHHDTPEQTEPPVERRQANAPDEDLLWRIGGDEIGLLVRNVTAEQLDILRHRLSDPLSVKNGIVLGAEGHVPIVASVTCCHVTTIHDTMDPYMKDIRHPLPVLDKLIQTADADHSTHKHDQYDAMWQYVLAQHRPLFRPFIDRFKRPADDRTIASKFIDLVYKRPETA